jgi:predicted CopG family antitoxin
MAKYTNYLNVRITDSEMSKLIELKTDKNQSSSEIIRSLIREKK